MSSEYGKNVRVSIFGQSHSPAIGVTVDGLPAGLPVDQEALKRFLQRRAPGRNAYSTPRKEADEPEFLCGLKDGRTCGAPLTAVIRNTNTRSEDYSPFQNTPRPGHADYTAGIKYGGFQDASGGGHFSGRLTAPLCIAGGICKQALEREGIAILSRIASVGDVQDAGELFFSTADRDFPTVDEERGRAMQDCIAKAREEGDSVGGVVECKILGVPVGLGDPMFDGLENRIAAIVFGIPAVKGLEFGAGFAAAAMRGSENNDSFVSENGTVFTATNHSGGILGGISNGMPITFRVAFKPTPSIAKEQDTVDLRTMEPAKLQIGGRHDPCIVPRAVPVVEAAAAIALYDAWLENRKYMR